jgi:hypothetical protein
MELINERIHHESSKNIYWTRFTAKFDDGSDKIVLVAAGGNFVDDNHDSSDGWLQKTLGDLRGLEESVRDGEIDKKVYSNTLEGEKNLMSFLDECKK